MHTFQGNTFTYLQHIAQKTASSTLGERSFGSSKNHDLAIPSQDSLLRICSDNSPIFSSILQYTRYNVTPPWYCRNIAKSGVRPYSLSPVLIPWFLLWSCDLCCDIGLMMTILTKGLNYTRTLLPPLLSWPILISSVIMNKSGLTSPKRNSDETGFFCFMTCGSRIQYHVSSDIERSNLTARILLMSALISHLHRNVLFLLDFLQDIES